MSAPRRSARQSTRPDSYALPPLDDSAFDPTSPRKARHHHARVSATDRSATTAVQKIAVSVSKTAGRTQRKVPPKMSAAAVNQRIKAYIRRRRSTTTEAESSTESESSTEDEHSTARGSSTENGSNAEGSTSTPVSSIERPVVTKKRAVAVVAPMLQPIASLEKALDTALKAFDEGQALDKWMRELRFDNRVEAQALLKEAQQGRKVQQAEFDRLDVMLHFEGKILNDERARLRAEGCKDVEQAMSRFAIVGVDEVGVGPLAGPLVGGAVVLHAMSASTQPHELRSFVGINDSKKLKPAEREQLAAQIQEEAVCHALGICTSEEVDRLNPRQASMEAMRRAVVALLDGPLEGYRVHLLVDWHTVPGMRADIGQTSMSKGDSKSQSIAAASIIAKVYRDAYMLRLHNEHPFFGFDRNAGYGTAEHMGALSRGKLCPEHRLSFAPVRAAHEGLQKRLAKRKAGEEEALPEQRSVRSTLIVGRATRKRTK